MVLDMIVGAAIFAGGAGFGWAVRPRRRQRQEEPVPKCGCGHHYALHDPQTSRCHATTRVMTQAGHGRVSWQPSECSCRTYTGPEPLPAFFAPAITG